MTPQKNDPLILRKSQNQKSFHLKREIKPNDGVVIGKKVIMTLTILAINVEKYIYYLSKFTKTLQDR